MASLFIAVKWVLLGAAAGFVAGFALPILIRPDLPQGPFLAIATTPAGCALGLLVGLYRWWIARRRR